MATSASKQALARFKNRAEARKKADAAIVISRSPNQVASGVVRGQ
jgi:hypothetical protein